MEDGGGLMNKDLLEGKWHQFKGKIKEKWGKLTDDDLKKIDGKKESFLGYLQTHYGYAKDRAEKELHEFEKTCGCGKSKSDEYRH